MWNISLLDRIARIPLIPANGEIITDLAGRVPVQILARHCPVRVLVPGESDEIVSELGQKVKYSLPWVYRRGIGERKATCSLDLVPGGRVGNIAGNIVTLVATNL